MIDYLANKGFFNWIPDKPYLKLLYKIRVGEKLNLKNPKTFNEKLQWLKLYDRKPEYTMMVDKYKVREYIAEKLGEEYLIPLLGVWDDPDEIDFDKLPNQFVLKCNHNSGLGMCICKDKSKLDIEKVKNELKKGLKQNYYKTSREWPYKNVERKIIAEKFMADEKSPDKGLIDYKFYCFNGKIKYLYVSQDLHDHNLAKIIFADKNWEIAPFTRTDYSKMDTLPHKPKNFYEMCKIAETLSNNIPFLRVDLYEINEKIFFSELTFYTGAGFTVLTPDKWNYILGDIISLKN